jgi:hypothetical protein
MARLAASRYPYRCGPSQSILAVLMYGVWINGGFKCFGTAFRVVYTFPSFPCLSASECNGNIVSARDNADAYWQWRRMGFVQILVDFMHVSLCNEVKKVMLDVNCGCYRGFTGGSMSSRLYHDHF